MRLQKKVRVIGFVVLVLILTLILAEVILRFMGAGDPPLYDANPLYGYRLLSNQNCRRSHGAHVKTNNLGLRANKDFDARTDNKILFLGDSVTYGGSYIDNTELFSTLAVQGCGYESGNAGVNAWGIENIYGLIVESGFLPANIYVTVVPEGDFYRGLTRCAGTPFFNTKPRLALTEVWRHLIYRQSITSYRWWQEYADEKQTAAVIRKATRHLREMDGLLNSRGFRHLLFITPGRDQALGKTDPDPIVQTALKEYNVPVIYLLDELRKSGLTNDEIRKLYVDGCHLSKKGHEVWASLIRPVLMSLDESNP